MASELTDEILQKMFNKGISAAEIGRQFGITRQAVQKRIKVIGRAVMSLGLTKDSKIIGKHLSTLEQLVDINERAYKIISENDNKPFIILQAMKRIERQNEIQLKMIQALHSMQQVEEFRGAVLEVLSEVDVELRNKVVEKLARKRSLAGILVKPGE